MAEPATDAPMNAPAEAALSAARRHPLGVLVVVALGLGRVVIESFALAVPNPSGIAEWIVGGSTIPPFEADTPGWLIGKAAIALLVVATAASCYGLWRFRTWGWSLALILAGVILALDLGWWLAGQPRYPSMFLNTVAVFYLNQRDVRAIYLPSST
jgi:hypothetical protein